jgi:hypothetical protein
VLVARDDDERLRVGRGRDGCLLTPALSGQVRTVGGATASAGQPPSQPGTSELPFGSIRNLPRSFAANENFSSLTAIRKTTHREIPCAKKE